MLMKPIRIFLKSLASICLTLIFVLSSAAGASAFCGFYVGGAGAKLFNKTSQVILAHEDNRTIITMANDFQGAVKDFALVVPVPVAIQRDQVNVGNPKIVEKLDAFSQPRLVQYTDENPCPPVAFDTPIRPDSLGAVNSPVYRKSRSLRGRDGNDGVTVEDEFKVKEFDILILSATESDGLENWLRRNGYQLPIGASDVLKPYIRQNMKFFVAKIDLQEFQKTKLTSLRPLQIAYESPKFMLPIRLGMLNAQGDQDLIVYLLSPKGQIELTNYRSVKIPTDQDIPEYIEEEFGKFYQATFQKSYEQAHKKVAFLEYAWKIADCDPCSAPSPEEEELKEAGVFWQNPTENTFITRLHVRYHRDRFAEDLVFQETSNQANFQGRYVMRHPYREPVTCRAAVNYRKQVADRQRQEAQNLHQLTGWNLPEIQQKIQPLLAPSIPRTRTGI
jgi:hypothetical protein